MKYIKKLIKKSKKAKVKKKKKRKRKRAREKKQEIKLLQGNNKKITKRQGKKKK